MTPHTTIYVDADACPAVIKDILFRVAERLQEDFDDRSEAWQDGANGFAARDMISAWGNPNYLKFLGIAVPVEPDCNIDEDGTSDASQELDDLPE